MSRMYPIFTNGKEFRHSSDSIPYGKWRTSYFSLYDLKEWKKRELPELTPEKAKMVFDNWEKKRKDD